MSQATHYSYTAAHVASAVDEIKATLFRGITREAIPKVLVVAGFQGSGKPGCWKKTCCRPIVTRTMFACT